MDSEAPAPVTSTAEEAEAPAEATSAKAKRYRAKAEHPMDRLLELIKAAERVNGRVVRRLTFEATDPSGWTLTADLEADEMGNARDSLHYDSPDDSLGILLRSVMTDFAGVLGARAREAEEEYRRCKSAIVRSLPPSERLPVTQRRRRGRRATGNGRSRAAATAAAQRTLEGAP